MIMVLGLRNARRARNLSLLASFERAAPTFIVRIFELGESGNMREALGRWVHVTGSMGKDGRISTKSVKSGTTTSHRS